MIQAHAGGAGAREIGRTGFRLARCRQSFGASRGIALATKNTLPGIDAFPDIARGLVDVEEALTDTVLVADPSISETTSYLLKAGGKRVRPALVLLGSKFGDSIGESAIDAAVAVELIHLGSLYHDDVIDESDTRRGLPSVNANWNNTIAILAGDFLLSKASEIGARLGREASELLARTLGDLVKGELRELTNAYNLESGLDDYWHVIENKTAALISASARLGGMVGGTSQQVTNDLAEYGFRIGIVFQIADDLLDLVSTEEEIGKPPGIDLVEGTYTLPVIHGLNGPNGDQLGKLLTPFTPAADGSRRNEIGDAELTEIRDLLRESGSITYAMDQAREHLAAADQALARLPANPVRDALEAMGEFILARVPLPS
ncbi:MAG: geranylgeranyl pyrophosphate synthase [Acidobacteria bacterium]|nr:MAG: geranylgeranyl pyrophosphate synthase [Acidobacteriota bacterium]